MAAGVGLKSRRELFRQLWEILAAPMPVCLDSKRGTSEAVGGAKAERLRGLGLGAEFAAIGDSDAGVLGGVVEKSNADSDSLVVDAGSGNRERNSGRASGGEGGG